nr:MAG TPA: tail sheath protein [Caudoviricetes sp.]
MAQININEISQNYSYNVATSSYATVALPITACWGPGYFDPDTYFSDNNEDKSSKVERMLEQTQWLRFPSSQEGLEKFIATYKGPATVYKQANDYSYQMAMTLLTAGYDILVCRLCPGAHATLEVTQYTTGVQIQDQPRIRFRAKYPGSYGNNLSIKIEQTNYNNLFKAPKNVKGNKPECFWTIITYVNNSESNTKTAVETHYVTFNPAHATDNILYYKDIDSKYWDIVKVVLSIQESKNPGKIGVYNPLNQQTTYENYMNSGSDYNAEIDEDDISTPLSEIEDSRYDWAQIFYHHSRSFREKVVNALEHKSLHFKRIALYRQWLFGSLVSAIPAQTGNFDANKRLGMLGGVYDLLKDKLSYNPNRIISPGWDDQDYLFYYDDAEQIKRLTGQHDGKLNLDPSPIALKLLDVAANSRCATAYIDIPRCLDRKFVSMNAFTDKGTTYKGYAQRLAEDYSSFENINKDGLLTTHAALFAPWGQYQYVGTSKMVQTSPSFLALMIQRAQILNQPIQYEWALPTNRKHNLRIGKLDWTVPKHLLDKWQSNEGVNINAITTLPDLGTNIWGNSTLFDTPPATYQALANLSTRLLVNAIEDVVYRVGLSITFQYNNDQAISKFYAGVSPILDTLKNVGAIENYKIKMNPDIRGLDYVNANTLIGKVYISVYGVINTLDVDLICLPPGAEL